MTNTIKKTRTLIALALRRLHRSTANAAADKAVQNSYTANTPGQAASIFYNPGMPLLMGI